MTATVVCPRCDWSGDAWPSLKRHNAEEHPAPPASRRCSTCGDFFATGADLTGHLRAAHAGNAASNAVAVIVIGVVALLAGVALWAGLSAAFSSGSQDPFSRSQCLADVDELLERYPQVYATRQEAYDGCRSGGELFRELRGDVDTSR